MKTEDSWRRKDLLTIEDLSLQELENIFQTASSFKKTLGRTQKKLPSLRGKTIVNLFMEPSTRTRIAFEIAAKRLSADVVSVMGAASSLVKGETLKDTARNVVALNADVLVIRHSAAGSPYYLSRIGDILFSRVARSNIWALKKLGAKVTLVGPSTLVPESFSCLGVEVSHNLKEALADADAVMLLRIQHERQTSTHFPSLGEYTSMFGLNQARASWLKPGALIMHPGPINRGVEIDSVLADSEHSVILTQVTNGIVCRMAVLLLCSNANITTPSPETI